MQTSAEGRRRLIAREGLRLEAYRDSVGVWTCGVGHTAAAGAPVPFPGMKITKQEAEDILSRDLLSYERAIDNALNVPVAQHEYDALVSICFNVGPKFAESTCIKRLNSGDRGGAAEAIMLWNKPPEIIGRRRSEYEQFKTPYKSLAPKPQNKAAVPAVVGGTAVGGAAAVAQQAGIPIEAVIAIAVAVALVAFLIWKFRK